MRGGYPDDDRTHSFRQLANGTVVGHYRIIERLGSGGMGEVYLAQDAKLVRKVALKFLPLRLSPSESYRIRFDREAQAVARLQHPYIIAIHDAGEFNDRPYFVMEHVEGRTLKEVIKDDSFTIDETIRFALQVCAGLKNAHEQGVIHRDIKPSNILIDTQGNARILDFGLAALQESERITTTGVTMGTVGYMSPEQAQGKDTDQRSDLFSLGVVLYELLAGRRPFQGIDPAGVLHAITHNEPEPITRYKSGLPDELQTIVAKALEKDLSLRYQSAGGMLADLKRLEKNGSTSVPSERGRPGRSRFAVYGIGAVIALFVLALAFESNIRQGVQNMWFHSGVENADQIHLAILPFDYVVDDQPGRAFCDGLVATLTSEMTRHESFRKSFLVIPSSETRREGVSSAHNARVALGATHVITGSMQVYGDRMRLTLNLVDAVAERQLRSTVIDNTISDELAYQDSVVLVVASMLSVHLQPEELRALMAGGTSTAGAYAAYVEARGYLQSTHVDSAIELLQQAVSQDPQYTLAYAGLGEAYWRKYQKTSESEWTLLAVTNTMKALELNDRIPQVHVSLGMIRTGMGKYEEALQSFRRAIELDSTSGDALLEMAETYKALGKTAEAESCYVKAIDLKPASWWLNFSLVHFYIGQGRNEEALARMDKVVALRPDGFGIWNNLGALYYYLGRPDIAHDMWQQSLMVDANYRAYSNLGALYYSQQQYYEAIPMYQKALEFNDRDYKVWMNLASAYHMVPEFQELSIETYREAIRLAENQRALNPRDNMLLVQLADCYTIVGDTQQAKALVDEATTMPVPDLNYIVTLGVVYIKLDEYDEAATCLKKAADSGYPVELLESLPEVQKLMEHPEYKETLRLRAEEATKGI